MLHWFLKRSMSWIICSVITQLSSDCCSLSTLSFPSAQEALQAPYENSIPHVTCFSQGLTDLRARGHFTPITIGTAIIKCSVSSPGGPGLSNFAVLIVCDYILIGLIA